MAERDRITLLAAYSDAQDLGEAVTRLREAGHRDVEIYSPIPVDPGGYPSHRTRWLDASGLAGALFGTALGLAITVGQNVGQYPLNVGGRPLFAWPAFLVPIFELGVLFGAIGAVLGFLRIGGLPRLHNPLFDAAAFERASEDRFLLAVTTGRRAAVERVLSQTASRSVEEIAA